MKMKLIWDEAKRREHLRKHDFDFTHADEMLASRFRLDVLVQRSGEIRTQSISSHWDF